MFALAIQPPVELELPSLFLIGCRPCLSTDIQGCTGALPNPLGSSRCNLISIPLFLPRSVFGLLYVRVAFIA
jgi:hypothetical protein